MAPVTPRLVMLGPAPGTRDSVASVVEAYRAHGLFKRWPIDYIAAYGDGGARTQVSLLTRLLARFGPLLARERSLVVHLHVSTEGGLGRTLALVAMMRAVQCPYIVHLHGAAAKRAHDNGGRPARLAIRAMLEQAAYVFVSCESMRAWARGVTRDANVTCMPDPVVPFEPQEDARQPNLVLFLGELDAAKGIFDLLEAVAALRPAVPDVRLLCASAGERGAVVRYAERLGIGDAVKFTGWLGPSGKRALLEAATVLALPSYEEALPMSVLEAMAAGVPVVVSPVGGMPEVVANGVSGLYAAPGDVATLQRQLRKLLLDRGLGARIGAAARESIRLRCAPERAIARLGAVYAALGLNTLGEAAEPLHAPRSPTAAL